MTDTILPKAKLDDVQGGAAVARHTPGPWKAGPHLVVASSNGDADVVCERPQGGAVKSRIYWEANARLIAAAPDQYAAGKEIDRLSLVIESAVRNADPQYHQAVVSALKANRAALTKAENGCGNG